MTVKITHVRGPYEVKSRGTWRMAWRENDKNKTYSHKDKQIIEEKIADLQKQAGLKRGKIKGDILRPLKNAQPSPGLFKQLTGDIIKASHQATIVGDLDALRRLKEHASIVSTLSKSYHPWSEVQKSIEEFRKLIEYHESTDKTALVEGTHATEQESGQSIASTLQTDSESSKAVFPVSD